MTIGAPPTASTTSPGARPMAAASVPGMTSTTSRPTSVSRSEHPSSAHERGVATAPHTSIEVEREIGDDVTPPDRERVGRGRKPRGEARLGDRHLRAAALVLEHDDDLAARAGLGDLAHVQLRAGLDLELVGLRFEGRQQPPTVLVTLVEPLPHHIGRGGDAERRLELVGSHCASVVIWRDGVVGIHGDRDAIPLTPLRSVLLEQRAEHRQVLGHERAARRLVGEPQLAFDRRARDLFAVECGAVEELARVALQPFAEHDELLEGDLVSERTGAIFATPRETRRDDERAGNRAVELLDEVALASLTTRNDQSRPLELLQVIVDQLARLADRSRHSGRRVGRAERRQGRDAHRMRERRDLIDVVHDPHTRRSAPRHHRQDHPV